MFYRAQSKDTGNMWDTWLFLHEGVYYLYILCAAHGNWDNISLATSTDGVFWTEVGPVLAKQDKTTWMGTGSTWTSPNFDTDGKFQMNFSEWIGPRQTIFFAESADLVNWTRLGDELEFVQDERWYNPKGRWDCIWTLPKPDGSGLYGYWTGTPAENPCGRFGFGQTADGVTWEALEPPVVTGGLEVEGEVGAIEKIGEKVYMMYGIYGSMITLIADQPEGPFHPAEKNRTLLAGHTYFSRFFNTGEELLANHHSILRDDGGVFFGLIKRVDVDGEGTMRLAWWSGNDLLKRQAIDVPVPAAGDGDAAAMLDASFDVQGGAVLEGDIALPADGDTRRGLYIDTTKGGAAALIKPDGSCELGTINADGGEFMSEMTTDREMAFGDRVRFRLVLKGAAMELYLGEMLIECFSLPAAATGRIGLFFGGDADAIGNLAAWHVSG